VTFGQYLLGLLLLAVAAGGCGAAAWIVVSRRLSRLPRYARGAAFGVLWAAALLIATLVPAALGLLGRASAPICAVALLAAAHLLVRPAASTPAREAEASLADPLLSRLLGWGAFALVSGWAIAAAWLGSAVPSVGRDSLTFHLPEAVRWMQTGTIWRVDQFEPLLANAYYPQNGDALNLAVLEPFRSDAFVRVLSVMSLPVMALAIYALARELRASPSAARLGAAVVAALPISVLTAEEGAKTDLWCIAALAVAGLFLLRNLRTGLRSDLVLGALALGLGFGTKWYGVTAALIVAAAWALARLWQRPRARAALGDAGLVAGLCALAGGIWLVRNWVESGNPVFPAPVSLGGLSVFSAPPDPIRQCADYTVVSYLGNTGVLRHVLWPIWRVSLGTGVLLPLAALAAAPVLGRPRRTFALLSLLGIALVAMYAVLPYSALGTKDQPVFAGPNVRYALPALALGGALLACVLPRLGRLRHVVELLALLAVADGLRHSLFISDGRLVAGVLVACALGAAWAIAGRRLPRRLAGVAIGAAAIVLAAGGYVRQRDFYDARYRGSDPALDVLSSTPSGTRVGLAGFESRGSVPHVLPAFGRRLGNEVTYVGVDDRGQLRPYDARGPFTAALERGGFEYLLVARAPYAIACTLPGAGSDPAGWAAAAGWRRVSETSALALYRRP
jgi:Dolichyl-phosphate-mannose-protein mannosyltransferase